MLLKTSIKQIHGEMEDDLQELESNKSNEENNNSSQMPLNPILTQALFLSARDAWCELDFSSPIRYRSPASRHGTFRIR